MEVNIVPKFIDNALSPPAKAVGNTLSNLWELGIGNHINLWVQKQETRHKQNLELYKTKIEEKTQAIPPENITEPNISVVGPAIEASKYYIDSEELREMFANLIAASIDNRKINKVHPSYVEIIKQLSPLDASILELFRKPLTLPICEYRLEIKNNKGELTHLTNVFLEYDMTKDLHLISSSISNLCRLGILQVSYTNSLIDKSRYNSFISNPYFKKLEHEVRTSLNDLYSNVKVNEGIIKNTPLGENFIKICLN